MKKRLTLARLTTLLFVGMVLIGISTIAAAFSYDEEALPDAKPWTSAEFQNDPKAVSYKHLTLPTICF